MGVGIDGEEHLLAADVVLLFGAGAGMPGELLVGAVEGELALAVLADEQHARWTLTRRGPTSPGGVMSHHELRLGVTVGHKGTCDPPLFLTA